MDQCAAPRQCKGAHDLERRLLLADLHARLLIVIMKGEAQTAANFAGLLVQMDFLKLADKKLCRQRGMAHARQIEQRRKNRNVVRVEGDRSAAVDSG